jgi:hypothetical protein
MRGSHLLRHYTTDRALKVLADHYSPAVQRSPKGNNLVCARAAGAWLTDVGGKQYLDFQTGIGVANTGHSHPRVVAAITEQVKNGIHLQQNCMISQPTVALLEELATVAPEGLSRFFFNCALRARARAPPPPPPPPPPPTHTPAPPAPHHADRPTQCAQARAPRRWSPR